MAHGGDTDEWRSLALVISLKYGGSDRGRSMIVGDGLVLRFCGGTECLINILS